MKADLSSEELKAMLTGEEIAHIARMKGMGIDPGIGAGMGKPKAQATVGAQNGRAAPMPAVLRSARASSFELVALQWLWPGRFALGKLGLLVGLPDEGKGQILADIAARTTRGGEWPCREGGAPKGNVVLLSAEDAPADTVVPR